MPPTRMRTPPNVEGLTIESLQGQFDAVLVACGFEPRSTSLVRRFQPHAAIRTAAGFASNTVGAFQDNKAFLESAGYSVDSVADAEFRDWLRSWLRSVVRQEGQTRILLDISSFSRFRLAATVQQISDAGLENNISAAFFYSLAKFEEPAPALPPLSVRPVIPEFAGWFSQPERQVAAIVGLGYEPERAIGALELIEPAQTWILLPESPIEEYKPRLEQANLELLRAIPKHRTIRFDPSNARATYRVVDDLVRAVKREYNVNIIPLGPKILALVAFIVASNDRAVQATRVSAGDKDPPLLRESSDHWTGLVATFDRTSVSAVHGDEVERPYLRA
jgi:hypothetical protein